MKAQDAPLRIAIFASGNGSNAKQIIAYFKGRLDVEIALILTDNATAGVIEIARKSHIPAQIATKSEYSDGIWMNAILDKMDISLVVLAGYLKKIPVSVVEKFQHRMINIHPSLLPAFGGKGMYGKKVHDAVMAQKEKKSGITIHYVTEGYDEGNAIFQQSISILNGWDAHALGAEIRKLEHLHFPFVVDKVSQSLKKKPLNEMRGLKKIARALISVYHKEGIDEIITALHSQGVTLYSTGGTADHIRSLNLPVVEVSDLTGFPSILEGRVKTLHPAIFGGILARRDSELHQKEAELHQIPMIDLVIIDLYPFEETLASGAGEAAVIEKIDIGGVSLIRAAAKNHNDVCIVSSREGYHTFLSIYQKGNGYLNLEERKNFAAAAFRVSSHYDNEIARFLGAGDYFHAQAGPKISLRYGENPHQKASFYGDLSTLFKQLHGKELSFNNLVDIESAIELVAEFPEPCFAIIKHTNPCGLALGNTIEEAWKKALECDPLSAFGGVLACNREITEAVAKQIDEIFFEVLIAPSFESAALGILQKKKNRILLQRTKTPLQNGSAKKILNGWLVQDKDQSLCINAEYKTSAKPTEKQMTDIHFGEIAVKHLKSNAIALVREKQLIGSGMGQTSRVDALKQAIGKAKDRGFSLENATLVSDAFFPFPDTAAIANEAGIKWIAQPGGSVKDQETIDYCEANGMTLVFTGLRHFKH